MRGTSQRSQQSQQSQQSTGVLISEDHGAHAAHAPEYIVIDGIDDIFIVIRRRTGFKVFVRDIHLDAIHHGGIKRATGLVVFGFECKTIHINALPGPTGVMHIRLHQIEVLAFFFFKTLHAVPKKFRGFHDGIGFIRWDTIGKIRPVVGVYGVCTARQPYQFFHWILQFQFNRPLARNAVQFGALDAFHEVVAVLLRQRRAFFGV